MQNFMVEPVTTWTVQQMLFFPWLFIVPAEIIGLISSTMIFLIGSSPWGKQLLGDNDLPHGQTTGKPLPWKDLSYIWFNRLVVLPLLSFIIVRHVWASKAIVWDPNKLNWFNCGLSFVIVFSLSDFSYYVMHRMVHRVHTVYQFVHQHHHSESEPIRGWADTCNAHPIDFFYTGVCTSPLSSLWLMPKGSVHIVAIALCLYVNSFVGSLGHCRLDLNVIFFNTRFHAGHHRYNSCNFAQNIELWDRIFGTYYDYSHVVEKHAKKQSGTRKVDGVSSGSVKAAGKVSEADKAA